MSVPQEIQALLDKNEFDAVEDAWLARLAENPGDSAYFGTVGRALGRAGEEERARFLLEMVDEEHAGSGAWEKRLELLRLAGTLYRASDELHPAILTTLDEIHAGSPSYQQMAEKVGLHRAIDDIPKTWKKVDRLKSLLAFDIGSIVYLEGKGAGRVAEVNMALESFKVELEQHGELRVGFGGAAKLLQPLPVGHILRRRLEERDELVRLRDSEAAELLRVVLTSYEKPRSGAEIRRDLAGIVDEGGWSSWWSAVRKHPQVLTAPGKRHAYSWAASQDHAQDAVWEAFEAAEPRKRIDLLRQNAGRDEKLKGRMAEALAATAAAAAAGDPGLACEIYFGLERYATSPGQVPWSPSALLAQVSDKEAGALAAGIKDRVQRERIYQLAREKRRGYPQLAVQLLWQEEEARALDRLAASLEEDAPELLGSYLDQLLSQPKKNPAAFTWLAERAADRPEWLRRNPPRLLKQILWALGSAESFAAMKSRLQPLMESGGTLPRLLSHMSEEQAVQAAETLRKTAALVDHQRKPLLNALYLRFPSLREEEAPLYATAESIARKRQELRQIAEEEIPANRRAIETAREMGDLRENFEYKSARDRHEFLSARATTLDQDLRRVRPIDPSGVTGNEIVIGSRVRFESPRGGSRALTILGPWDSKPEEDILSNESDLAKALLGTALGKEVEIGGETYRVAAIEPAL